MNSKPFGFVDANVLANAIIVENEFRDIRVAALEKLDRREKIEKKREEFFRGYEIGRSAYELFHKLHEPKTPERYVVTSNLAKLEVTGVIAAEFKCRQLFKRHVPFRYWFRSQDKIRLTKEDLREIQVSIYLFLHKMAHAIVTVDEYNAELAGRLITEFGCDTRDAILVATAAASNCPLFITEDERLQTKLKRFKDLEVRKPQFAVNSLNMGRRQ